MEIVFLTFILVLSIFLGFELISKVPATLHTPLMSGANAISGITLAGAFVSAGAAMTVDSEFAKYHRKRCGRISRHRPHVGHV